MNIPTPLAGALAQSSAVVRLQQAEKSKQVRRVQELAKNVATGGEPAEHQVESSEELSSTHDDNGPGGGSYRHQEEEPAKDGGDQDWPHLDVRG